MTSIIVGAALVIGGLFGTIASATTTTTPVPYCPQEDSCTPDYDGRTNSWVIHEDR